MCNFISSDRVWSHGVNWLVNLSDWGKGYDAAIDDKITNAKVPVLHSGWERLKHIKLSNSVVMNLAQRVQEARDRKYTVWWKLTWGIGAFGTPLRFFCRRKNRGGHFVWPSGGRSVFFITTEEIAGPSTWRS